MADCPTPDPCTPGPANEPASDADLGGSLGVTLQPDVDAARKLVHDLGLRGYRVWLVWQRRNSTQRFEEIKRIELMPVLVSSLAGVGWESSPSGMHPEGDIVLSEVSPAQVNGRVLFGEHPDLDNHLDPDIEFFYEITVRRRCPDQKVRPGRFTPASLPHYDAENFQWVINLVDQEAPRTPEDSDTADNDGAFQTERDTLRARRGRKKTSLRT